MRQSWLVVALGVGLFAGGVIASVVASPQPTGRSLQAQVDSLKDWADLQRWHYNRLQQSVWQVERACRGHRGR